MSSEDEVQGQGHAATSPPKISGRRRQRQPTRPRRGASRDVSGPAAIAEDLPDGEVSEKLEDDDKQSEEDEHCCRLCVEPLQPGSEARLHGFPFHFGECFNAVRSGRRSDRQLMDDMMKNSVQEWRRLVLPLRAGSRQRDQKVRRELNDQVTKQKETYKRNERETRKVVLNKRRCKAFLKFWDGMDSDEASSEFEHLLRKQGGRCSIAGENMVEVDDNPVNKTITGSGTKTIDTRATHRSRSPQRQDRIRGPVRLSQSGRGRSKDRKAREHDRERQRRRDRPPSSAAADDDSHEGDFGDRSEASSFRPPASLAGSSRLGSSQKVPLTKANLQRMGRQQPVAEKLKAATASTTASGTKDKLGSQPPSAKKPNNEKLSPLEVMKELDASRVQLDEALKKCSGKHSLEWNIKAAVAKMSPDKVAALETQPSHVLEQLQTKRAEIQSLLDKAEGTKSSQLQKFQTDVEAKVDEWEQVLAEATEVNDGLQYLLQKDHKKEKGATNHQRYLRFKLRTKLVGHGFGQECAKLVAASMEEVQSDGLAVNPLTFRPEVPSVWRHDEAATTKAPLLVHLEAVLAKADTDYKSKQESLEKAMDKNSKWTGCSARLPAALDGLANALPDIKFDRIDDGGAQMWVVCCLSWAWRWGPQAVPLPGIACVIFLPTTAVPTFFHLHPVDGILEQGIALQDTGKFFETESGAKFLKQKSLFVTLAAGEALWVPSGWVASPVVTPAISDADADDKQAAAQSKQTKAKASTTQHAVKKHAPELGFFVHLPCFYEPLIKQMADQTRQAVFQWNQDHLNKNKTAKLFVDRYKFFSEFVKGLSA